jgi:hypothetical protein
VVFAHQAAAASEGIARPTDDVCVPWTGGNRGNVAFHYSPKCAAEGEFSDRVVAIHDAEPVHLILELGI